MPCPPKAVRSAGADQGFAAERVWVGVAEQGITAFVPPEKTMLPSDGEPKTDAQRQALAARERCKTEQGVCAHKRRMADAEGAISELKNEHGLDRARCRGTSLFHVQLLLGCAALNLKRLTAHTDAASGKAAGRATGQTASLRANQDPDAAPAAAHGDHHAAHAITPRVALAAPTAWTITLSMN